VANQRIEIDLDDGVKVNYAKFQGVEIPQGKGRKPLKADLLARYKVGDYMNLLEVKKILEEIFNKEPVEGKKRNIVFLV